MSSWGKFNANQPLKKSWRKDEAHEKLSNYCAYQERCQWEARRKLYEKGIKGNEAEGLISEMITGGFIDEERYARSFARGKLRLKKWGKIRIQRELKSREITSRCIEIAMSEIDPHEYYNTLLSETEKKWAKTIEKDPYKKKIKVVQYLLSKGFEQDLVRNAVEEEGKRCL